MQMPGKSGGLRATQTTLSEINVTPLVDVMLVLLIVFMVSAPLMQQGVQVNLPRANAGTMLDVSLAEHLALTMGARAVVGDDLHPSVRVTGVDLSRAGFEPPPVEEITERLSSTSVNASTTSLRLLAGLKVVF